MATVSQIEKTLNARTILPVAVRCPYCGKYAKLVDGALVYPSRKDLYGRKFWVCKPCDARVGTHANSERHEPLGTLANRELRSIRTNLHVKFDSLWKEHIYTRNSAYKWLAKRMGISSKQCHIGSFDKVTCTRAMFFVLAELKRLKK